MLTSKNLHLLYSRTYRTLLSIFPIISHCVTWGFIWNCENDVAEIFLIIAHAERNVLLYTSPPYILYDLNGFIRLFAVWHIFRIQRSTKSNPLLSGCGRINYRSENSKFQGMSIKIIFSPQVIIAAWRWTWSSRGTEPSTSPLYSSQASSSSPALSSLSGWNGTPFRLELWSVRIL